jgi:LysM repeat protein
MVAVFGFLLAVPSAAGKAQLTIEARTGSATSVLQISSATLACDGGADATGYLRNVAGAACAATRDGAVGKVVAAQRRARICTEEYGGPQTARITGTVNGKRVTVGVTRSDGCGIADWETLRALLGDPERRGRIPRPTRTTAPSTSAPPVVYQVQRGDTLTVIARRFHTTIGAITDRNQLEDPDNLAEGQTLEIPAPSSVQLNVTLMGAGSASGFELTLTGVQPGEPVTFAINLPDGSTHTGSPHVASEHGEVSTTYQTSIGSGVYGVVATADDGTGAELRFHVDPGRG